MTDWTNEFLPDDIFFVTPDVKRALGFAGVLPKYHIICSYADPIIPVLRHQGAKIFCLEEKSMDGNKVRNSGKLLEMPRVLLYIKNNSTNKPKVMYFKPSLKIDQLIRLHGFLPVGNIWELNELFEDKIIFHQNTANILPEYTVPATIAILGNLNYNGLYKQLGLPLVVQFGHGWAGKTTFFIKTEKEFASLVQKFPYTKARISKYIDGFTVLNNCCVYQGKVMVSDPAIQIDGIAGLGGKSGVTCGRQWPAKFLDKNQIETVNKISQIIGSDMSRAGYKGFFGVDLLVEEKTNKIYLSEVNARMTASSAFFTSMEIGLNKIPLLAYHLAEFLGKSLPVQSDSHKEMVASQIIFRKPIQSVFKDKLFGVFSDEKQAPPVFIRDGYYPQNLASGEFIFMGRKVTDENSDNEYGRLETKSEVLEKPKKLKSWVEELTGKI